MMLWPTVGRWAPRRLEFLDGRFFLVGMIGLVSATLRESRAPVQPRECQALTQALTALERAYRMERLEIGKP
jgi:hypothetical protein